jgi:hypothetical protein
MLNQSMAIRFPSEPRLDGRVREKAGVEELHCDDLFGRLLYPAMHCGVRSAVDAFENAESPDDHRRLSAREEPTEQLVATPFGIIVAGRKLIDRIGHLFRSR